MPPVKPPKLIPGKGVPARTFTSSPVRGWVWPTTSTRITQQPGTEHIAFDIGALSQGRQGDPIFSPTTATVERILWQPEGYGLNLRLRAESGQEIILAHLAALAPGITEGLQLTPRQLVGLMGSTGQSSGAHLHYEVRTASGTPFDPRSLYALGPSPTRSAGALPATSTFRFANPTPLVPQEQVSRGVLSGQAASSQPGRWIGTTPARQPSGDIRVASTPIGDVTVPKPGGLFKRAVVVGVGLVILFISLAMLARPTLLKTGKELTGLALDVAPGTGELRAVAKGARRIASRAAAGRRSD